MEEKRVTMEELLTLLKAKYSKIDEKTYSLLEHNNQTCGLLSTDFNFDGDHLSARLVFNDDKELIGMGFNDIGDNELYHDIRSCTPYRGEVAIDCGIW